MSSPDVEAEFDPFEHEPARKNSNGNGFGGRGAAAWLALLLAAVAVSWNAWQWWQQQSVIPEEQGRQQVIGDMQRAQSNLSASLAALGQRIGAVENRDDSGAFAALQSDIGAIQSRLSEFGLSSAEDHALVEALQVLMADIEQRIGEMETSLAALAVRGESPGRSMDLAEVDYLLRLASERLVLFGDAGSADRALDLADTQLEAMEDPLYLPVRRRISEARQALRALPEIDLVATSARIDALQAAISGLVFPGEAPVPAEAVPEEADAGWWQRVKSALKPLVKVRRRVHEELELSLDDKDILRQGLWLQLESARLALMRKDAVGWDLALTQARSSVERRFDQASVPVANALDEIDGLLLVDLSAELPDISAPWRQLRLLREGRAGSRQPVAADRETGPAEQAAADKSEDTGSDVEQVFEDTDPDG